MCRVRRYVARRAAGGARALPLILALRGPWGQLPHLVLALVHSLQTLSGSSTCIMRVASGFSSAPTILWIAAHAFEEALRVKVLGVALGVRHPIVLVEVGRVVAHRRRRVEHGSDTELLELWQKLRGNLYAFHE